MTDTAEKVLISRTRCKKANWLNLATLAPLLTKITGREVTREMLVDLAFDSLLKYYEDVLMPKEEKTVTPGEILRAASNTEPDRAVRQRGYRLPRDRPDENEGPTPPDLWGIGRPNSDDQEIAADNNNTSR